MFDCMTGKTVYLKAGDPTDRYFSKCFKDIYHVSPLAYRKGEEADKDEEEVVNEK